LKKVIIPFILSLFWITFLFNFSDATDRKGVLKDSKNPITVKSLSMTENNIEQQKPSDPKDGLLVAASPEKKCIYCDLPIPINAHVCAKCGRDQRWYFNYVRIGDVFLLISILISVFIVYYSHKNLKEIQSEHVKASQAFERARAAEDKVEDSRSQLQKEIKKGDEDVARIGSLVREVETEIVKANQEVLNIKEKVKKESERVAKVEESQEQSTLVKTIIHKKSSNLSEDILRGQVHKVMGPYTLTLPPAKVGLSGTFRAGVSATFSVKARQEDLIILGGTSLSNGNKISSDGSTGAMIKLVCLNPNTWEDEGSNSTFIDGGK
jgi:hypothetical protein